MSILDQFGNSMSLSPIDNKPMPNVAMIGSLPSLPTVTIANGAALSGAVDLVSQNVIGISTPAAWTAASITFAVSQDNATFNPLYYQGAEFTLPEAGASRQITIDPTALLPWRYVKVRSGTSGTPVNQGQSTVITLLTKPIA